MERRPLIPPCLDREAVAANPPRDEAGLPAIIIHRVHLLAMPCNFVHRTPQQVSRQHVVAIGENVGADRNAIAHQPLHGGRTVRDDRLDRFDDDARSARGRAIDLSHSRIADRNRSRIGNDPHFAGVHGSCRRVRCVDRFGKRECRPCLRRQRRKRQIDRRGAPSVRIGQYRESPPRLSVRLARWCAAMP